MKPEQITGFIVEELSSARSLFWQWLIVNIVICENFAFILHDASHRKVEKVDFDNFSEFK